MNEMRFWLPENLDIDEIVRKNGIEFYRAKLKKEKLIFICDAIVNSRAQHRNQINQDESDNSFAPLSSVILQEVIYDYRNYLDFLLSNQIIGTDNHWVEGEKCIGYCFLHPYIGQRLKEIRINNYSLKKARRRAYQKQELEQKKATWGYGYLTKWWDADKLKIDLGASVEWLEEYENRKIQLINQGTEKNKQELINRAIETTEDLKQRARSINYNKASYCFSGQGKRFYNPISNLKKELRNFLTYDGQELVEIDCKNSQPFLATCIFKSSFWENFEKSEKLSLKEISKDINKEVMKSYEIKNIITLLKSSENLIQQGFSFEKYKKLVLQGQFYEYIMHHFNQIYNYGIYTDRFDNRDNVKREVLRIFYVNNSKTDLPFYRPCLTFRTHFPEVYELFRLIKEIQSNFLPIILQRIESFLFLDIICKKIAIQFPELLILTLHDSIITTKGNENIVQEIISNEIIRWTGEAPSLGIKNLEPISIAA